MGNLTIIGSDGINGCGKTKLLKRIIDDSDLGPRCVYTHTRFPSSPYVEEMYLIIHKYRTDFKPLELFAKDMNFRFSQMPEDKIILADRTFLSLSIFYDEISRLSKIQDLNLQREINQYKAKYVPKINILLLTDPQRALQRITSSRKNIKPVEELDFMRACEQRFEKIKPAENVLVVDANNKTEEEVFLIVTKRIKESL